VAQNAAAPSQVWVGQPVAKLSKDAAVSDCAPRRLLINAEALAELCREAAADVVQQRSTSACDCISFLSFFR